MSLLKPLKHVLHRKLKEILTAVSSAAKVVQVMLMGSEVCNIVPRFTRHSTRT